MTHVQSIKTLQQAIATVFNRGHINQSNEAKSREISSALVVERVKGIAE